MVTWLLWSQTRAVKILGFIVGGLAVLAFVTFIALASKVPAPPQPASANAGPGSSPTTTRTFTDGSPVMLVTSQWVAAWLSPPADPAVWKQRLAPYSTPRLLALTVATSPAAIPSASVREITPTLVEASIATVKVRLSDGQFLSASLVKPAGVWLVDDWRPDGT